MTTEKYVQNTYEAKGWQMGGLTGRNPQCILCNVYFLNRLCDKGMENHIRIDGGRRCIKL